MLTHFFYKEDVIVIIKKYRLFVIASVVNVIAFILYEVHKILFYDGLIGSGRFQRPEPLDENMVQVAP